LGSDFFESVSDYILWYAKDKRSVKTRSLMKPMDVQGDAIWSWVELPDGKRRRLKKEEIENHGLLPDGSKVYRLVSMLPAQYRPNQDFQFEFNGVTYNPPSSSCWKTNERGMQALAKANRLQGQGNGLQQVMFAEDYPVSSITALWGDTGGAADKTYVVQTSITPVERCILASTDPGDLVLDPTCGSGTIAYVAEKWGRRWITCDTSRVSVTLAKQRLMTASYDYYELRYPNEGLRGGFMYKTVPHVMLKSIANNPEIDDIHERMRPTIEVALEVLNAELKKRPPVEPFVVADGARKGEALSFSKGAVLQEWEVPFDLPESWSAVLREPFDSFQAAQRSMRRQIDLAIASHAESEVLYDEPAKSKMKMRITGPFTVEAVPFPSVLSLDETEQPKEADVAIARSGESARQHSWRDELLKTGIRGKGGQMLKFAGLDTLAGTACLHASGTLDTGERVVVSFGPEYGALEQRQVEHALREASELFPLPKMIVFCAFEFDPEAAKDIDAVKGITALKAKMNTDLLTEDLKKARSSNQSFWLMGQPDVELRKRKDGNYEVEVNGFDYFDTAKGELVSGGKAKIAMWLLDTDYDDRSLFPRQVFFPMAGKDEGWKKLRRDIRAELDESQLDKFHGTVSLPFEPGDNAKVAVKIVDDRGIESVKILPLV